MAENENTTAIEVLKIQNPEKFETMNNIANVILLSETKNHFHMAALKANAVAELKKLMPVEFVQSIKNNLENTQLGFMTDRKEGYPVDVIQRVLIEGALKGCFWHDNEINILASNMYITKNGMKGKMQRSRHFKDVKLDMDIPEIVGKKATVQYKATWKYNDISDSIEGKIPIKLQFAKNDPTFCVTSDDAIFGKANRKIRARIWEQATGNAIPEGEIETEEGTFEIVENDNEIITGTIDENVEIENAVVEPPTQKTVKIDCEYDAETKRYIKRDTNGNKLHSDSPECNFVPVENDIKKIIDIINDGRSESETPEPTKTTKEPVNEPQGANTEVVERPPDTEDEAKSREDAIKEMQEQKTANAKLQQQKIKDNMNKPTKKESL